MFDNIGSKVKNLAMAVCALGIIASVIGAIVLWTSTTTSYGRYGYTLTEHPYIALGCGVLAGGILSSLISAWVLYAIGEAAQNTATIVKQNEQLLEKLNSKDTDTKTPEAVPGKVSEAAPVHPAPTQTASNTSDDYQPKPEQPFTMVKCPNCGCENPSSVKSCLSCGASLQ